MNLTPCTFRFDCVAACRVFCCRIADAIVDNGLNACNIVDSSGAGDLSVSVDISYEDFISVNEIAKYVRANIVL
jgi:hypothetical protein